jgi:hypothetical protein
MNQKCITQVLYRSQCISPDTKESISQLLLAAVCKSEFIQWRQLLVNALEIKAHLFEAYSPVHKSRILRDLCAAIRRLKRGSHYKVVLDILDQIFGVLGRHTPGADAAAYFRKRRILNPDPGLKALFAGLIMELPEQFHRIDDAVAAIHGDYILAIRAMERLCALGDPGVRALEKKVGELSLTPAVAFTLLKILENATCDNLLKRSVVERVLAYRDCTESSLTCRDLFQPSEPELQRMRLVEVRRAMACLKMANLQPTGAEPRKSKRNGPFFRRLAAATNHKLSGGNHVGEKNHKNASLCGGLASDSEDLRGQRLRLSFQLKNSGFRQDL